MRSFVTCILYQILLGSSNQGGWVEHVARTGETINTYKTFVGKSEGKKPLGRRRRRWEDNIRMDLRKSGQERVEWMHLAQEMDLSRAVVNIVMDLRVP
jgi:hypothetical protein